MFRAALKRVMPRQEKIHGQSETSVRRAKHPAAAGRVMPHREITGGGPKDPAASGSCGKRQETMQGAGKFPVAGRTLRSRGEDPKDACATLSE